MQYIESNSGFEIWDTEDFDAEKIFECGQCFRWDRQDDGSYLGIVGSRPVRLSQNDGRIRIEGGFESFSSLSSYFDLERDYAAIRRRLSGENEFLKNAAEFGAGIRILKQDFWETLCSFIISQCNNIPRIKKIISVLCSSFGTPVEAFGRVFFSFPSAETIAQCSESDLAALRCGYRAEYILSAARALASGELSAEVLSGIPANEVLRRLKSLRGIGDKVANCVMLFGLGLLSAFPQDVWIKRAMKNELSGFEPERYGDCAGIVQQYIFYYYRSLGTKH